MARSAYCYNHAPEMPCKEPLWLLLINVLRVHACNSDYLMAFQCVHATVRTKGIGRLL